MDDLEMIELIIKDENNYSKFTICWFEWMERNKKRMKRFIDEGYT